MHAARSSSFHTRPDFLRVMMRVFCEDYTGAGALGAASSIRPAIAAHALRRMLADVLNVDSSGMPSFEPGEPGEPGCDGGAASGA